MNYRWLIATRYLVSRKQVSLISTITSISVVGVALGVAALIVVLSVMNGFYSFVRDLLVSLDPHVRIERVEERGVAEADSLLALAREIPHVAEATAYIQGKALLVYEGSGSVDKVVVVRGVDAAGGAGQVAEHVTFGTFGLDRRQGRPGAVLGMSLGQRLGLAPGTSTQPGSRIALLSAPALEASLTSLMGVPRAAPFEVRGLYQLESVFDESHVYVGLDEARRLFRMPEGRVSGLELRLDDLHQADAVAAELRTRLGDGYRVQTWYDLQRSLYDVMRLEKWGASLILALIIVVAAFNIVGSLTMVVIEKQRDVGVLQAMGVSRRDIRRIFLTEGLLIGLVGAGFGFALGLGLSLAQQRWGFVPLADAESFMIDAYPVEIQVLDLAAIFVVAVGLCVLAALYPALRAAAVQPARAVQIDG